MIVLAIDPGNEESAFVRYDSESRVPERFGKVPNAELLGYVGCPLSHRSLSGSNTDHLAIEMIASYGMPVGRETFDTCLWIGRFIQAWANHKVEGHHTLIYRAAVKSHLCHDSRAKDGNIRTSLIDMFGGKDLAVGTKKAPGVLYGISADVWSALAVAVTYTEKFAALAGSTEAP